MKGHHGAQLFSATAHETPVAPVVAHQVHVQTPLAVLQLQPRAKRAADGVTEAVRALGSVGRVAHGVGQSPSEEALSKQHPMAFTTSKFSVAGGSTSAQSRLLQRMCHER